MIKLDSKTVLPLPLGASRTILNGTLGTCECLLCLHVYSVKPIGLMSKLIITKNDLDV